MRLVVVSLLVLGFVAFVSAQAGAPEIRKISILDLLNSNPELKAELAKGIQEESRNSKLNVPTRTTAKPRPAPTTTSSPVAQADSPVDPPASTDPTPLTNAPGRRRRPSSTHRFAGERGRPRTRANAVNAVNEEPKQEEEQQQNGRQRPQNARRRPATDEQPSPQAAAAEAEEQPTRRRPTRPLRPRQQNGRTRPVAAAVQETAAPVEAAAVEVEEQGEQQQNARRRRPGARRRRPTNITDNAESVPAEEQPVERPTRRRTNGRTFPGRQS